MTNQSKSDKISLNSRMNPWLCLITFLCRLDNNFYTNNSSNSLHCKICFSMCWRSSSDNVDVALRKTIELFKHQHVDKKEGVKTPKRLHDTICSARQNRKNMRIAWECLRENVKNDKNRSYFNPMTTRDWLRCFFNIVIGELNITAIYCTIFIYYYLSNQRFDMYERTQ